MVSLLVCWGFEADLSVVLRGGFCPKVTAPELNIVRTSKTATKNFIVGTPLTSSLIVERIILLTLSRLKRRSARLIQKVVIILFYFQVQSARSRHTLGGNIW